MGVTAPHELATFLGPRPGWTYVYGLLDDDAHEQGSLLTVIGLAELESGVLRIRQTCALRAGEAGAVEASHESFLFIEGADLVQEGREGRTVLLRAPLRVGTAWTRTVVGYSDDTGSWRHEMSCRIAMIESVPVFGENRLAIRVVGRAALPVGEVTLVEQHAAGIGLVLRRQQMEGFAPSETVLEEVREPAPGR